MPSQTKAHEARAAMAFHAIEKGSVGRYGTESPHSKQSECLSAAHIAGASQETELRSCLNARLPANQADLT
jgi:hypothetical protein